MEVRPIDANALLTVPNVNKVTEYDEMGCFISYNAVSVESIDKAPTLDYVPRQQWNSVKDNPPGMAYRLVYVFTTNTIEIAKYKGTLWRTRDRRVIHSDEVKYWMPLPEPPKE